MIVELAAEVGCKLAETSAGRGMMMLLAATSSPDIFQGSLRFNHLPVKETLSRRVLRGHHCLLLLLHACVTPAFTHKDSDGETDTRAC